MDKIALLLKFFAEGGALDDCWRAAGFASPSAAADALRDLARSLAAPPGAEHGKRRAGLSVVVYVDGASRGNPGPAAVGAAVYTAEGGELYSRGKRIGEATNNVAEYRAVIEGLAVARELGASAVTIRLDSELVYRQLMGAYRIKSPDLKRLGEEIGRAVEHFEKCEFQQIPREKNREADRIANEALNSPLSNSRAE
jgi:ribonuclease HI